MPDTPEPKPGTADEGLGVAKDGWFTELSTLWPGQGLSVKVDKILFQGKSDFQNEPKKVLVIGGGDGGVLREVSRHTSVQEIHQAELDEMVANVSKEYLPQLAVGYSDPRVHTQFTDGIKFVEEASEAIYDAIIVDSSDPVGPAAVLFEKPFFTYMHRALKPGGVVCTQGESLWLHLNIIKRLSKMCREVFVGGDVQYAFTTIPTYPSGQIGFMICSKPLAEGGKVDVTSPKRSVPAGSLKKFPKIRYYNEEIHRAAFVLPQFARDALQEGSSM